MLVVVVPVADLKSNGSGSGRMIRKATKQMDGWLSGGRAVVTCRLEAVMTADGGGGAAAVAAAAAAAA